MSKSKSLKQALCVSLLSIVICCAMLIGTTFAWFTDSVSSANNKIASGNLDVELYQVKGGVETLVTEGTNLFSENALWEPGYTEVIYLKVKNAGALALKYQLSIQVVDKVIGQTADGKDIDLTNFIEYGITEVEHEFTDDAAGRTAARDAVSDSAALISEAYTSPDGYLTAGASTENLIALVVYMPENVDNDANYGAGKTQPEITLGVTLVATQDTVESDSFDDQYDNDAKYLSANAATMDDLLGALNNSKNSVAITITENLKDRDNYRTVIAASGIDASIDIGSNAVYAKQVQVTEGGKLTISADTPAERFDKTINNSSGYQAVLMLATGENSELNINGGKYEQAGSQATIAQAGPGATITITDGTFSTSGAGGKMFVADGGTIIITGGSIGYVNHNNGGVAFTVSNGGTIIVSKSVCPSVSGNLGPGCISSEDGNNWVITSNN